MSAEVIISLLDALLNATPNGEIVGIYDVEAGDLLVQRPENQKGELDLALASAAIAQANLANIHMDFDTGPPKHFSFDNGEHYICAAVTATRFLIIVVGKGSGFTGLSATILDGHLVKIERAILNALQSS